MIIVLMLFFNVFGFLSFSTFPGLTHYESAKGVATLDSLSLVSAVG